MMLCSVIESWGGVQKYGKENSGAVVARYKVESLNYQR